VSYIPHTESDVAAMLRTIGVASVDELFDAIPAPLRLDKPLSLPEPLDELAFIRHMEDLAGRNWSTPRCVSFLGAGVYDHFVPAVVDALVSRGEFLTSYTPYQPELSQGMLQAMYEFQSLVCTLTGMDMANASMYDAATALAEAALMLVDATGRRRVLASRAMHPHYRHVVRTYLTAAEVEYEEVHFQDGRTDLGHINELLRDPAACVLVQYPNFFGCLEDLQAFQGLRSSHDCRTVAAVDPVAMAILRPPGEYDFDVVVGEGQSLAAPLSFGGPLLGFFAFKQEYYRRFPGRIVGATHDGQGRRGFTMTLRTREQDIRRERATSNICTNEALLSLAMAVSLCALGPTGLRKMAEVSAQKAHFALEALAVSPRIGRRFGSAFFKEFVLQFDTRFPVHDICRRLRDRGILAGYPLGRDYPELGDCLLVCVTEKRTRDEIRRFAVELGSVTGAANYE